MAGTVWVDGRGGARRAWRSSCARAAERNPVRVTREVLNLTFRGSRAELDQAAALRLQATVALLFLAVRCVHLGQAGVDLALAEHRYTHAWLALTLGGACAVESLVVAALILGERSLTPAAMLTDTAFGLAGLAAMAIATSSGPARAGSLNWMLPYTVATATGLGIVAAGDLSPRSRKSNCVGTEGTRSRTAWRVAWPALLALALTAAFIASAYLPHRLQVDSPGQIWGDAANYLVFFCAGALTLLAARRPVMALTKANTELARATAEVARAGEWRAIKADVFGPVIDLIDKVIELPDGEIPPPMLQEAGQLMQMIDSVDPGEADALNDQSEALAR
jgi:hypothetical protein